MADTAVTATAVPGESLRLQMRRGQRIGLDAGSETLAYRVEQGCLTCEVNLPSGDRHIVLVLFPGDVVKRGLLAPLSSIRLTAAMPSNVTRLTLHPTPSADRDALAGIVEATSRLLARSCLYATAMGRLSAEERLATLICDIALHLGRSTPGGFTFDLPLTRRDMADHLALNPDSLSRLMSRFKTRGLLSLPTRFRAISRDLDALLATTPFGPTLQAMAADGASKGDAQ